MLRLILSTFTVLRLYHNRLCLSIDFSEVFQKNKNIFRKFSYIYRAKYGYTHRAIPIAAKEKDGSCCRPFPVRRYCLSLLSASSTLYRRL
nr:MAG TPA: hypothetical protein [Caudoviricetes sp.]